MSKLTPSNTNRNADEKTLQRTEAGTPSSVQPPGPACKPPVEAGSTGNNPQPPEPHLKPATTRRSSNGTFLPGASGNPQGRPLGSHNRFSRNHSALLARTLIEERAAELTNKVIEEALAGNPIAMKLCIDRLLAPPQDRPVQVELPPQNAAPGDILKAHSAVVQSVAAGELTPQEGRTISSILDSRRRSWEAVDLDQRLNNIEDRLDESAKSNGKSRR